jgi:hypothetical protein
MLDLIGNLNLESRRAVFASLMNAHRNGASEITLEMVAGQLLRAPSNAALCNRLGFDEAALLEALGISSEIDNGALQEWPDGMFMSLPMTERLKSVATSLAARAADHGFESITPTQLLAWLLEDDQVLSATCSRFGLTSSRLEGAH